MKVVLTFDQIDIGEGKFNHINKLINLSTRGQIEVDLSPRIFINGEDPIGIIQLDPDEVVTLGLEGRPQLSQDESIWPNSLKLQLADIKRYNERQVYQIMSLFGDFGGFNDGILFLPAIVMSIYNSKMFSKAVSTLFPVKHRHGDHS